MLEMMHLCKIFDAGPHSDSTKGIAERITD